jgi:type II secretory pathway pseudopilin PulG
MNIAGSRRATKLAGLVAVLAFAAGCLAVSTATASPGSRVTATQARAAQVARARLSLMRYMKASTPLAQLANGGPVSPSSPNISAGAQGTAQAGSYNWGGYADSSSPGAFTAVSATWVQPVTICSPEQRATAFWVGLDGWVSTTVEQDGVLAYCFEGKPYYFSWWEMFPTGVTIVGSTVQPGDLITASVTVSGGSNYTLSLTDATRPADSFSTAQTCAPTTCQDSSAEWIVERPAFNIGVGPLSLFSPWNVLKASQTSGGVTGSIASGADATQVLMVDASDTYQLASVSGLNRAGDTFNARWLNSY